MPDRDFGNRVRRAREKLGAKRRLVAVIAGLPGNRLALIEAGQLSSADVPAFQLAALAQALRCPLADLISGQEVPEVGPASAVAYRSIVPATQAVFAFPDECPHCGTFAGSGSRCQRCGHPLE